MIKTIRLKDCIPYNFAEISNCKKVNFIFGSNGSGKSTISAFLAGTLDSRYDSSSIDWYSETHESICVYNKKFRKDNFKETIPGVFTLGNATIEEIEKLGKIKTEHELLVQSVERLSESLRDKEDEISNRISKFSDEVWQHVLKKNEQDFQKAFDGFRGNKEKFRIELERRLAAKQGIVCSIDNLKERAKTLYSGKLNRCPQIILEINELCNMIEEIENNPIWEISIIGNDDVDVAALIKKLDNSSWVNQGLKFIDDSSNVCPFCQQKTITKEFRKQIEEFFDEEYSNKVNEINKLRSNYISISKEIIDIINNNVPYEEEETIMISNFNVEDFHNKVLLLQSAIDKNILEIEKKINKPETKIAIIGIENEVNSIIKIVDDANKMINAHNLLVDNQKKEEISLTNDIWASCIEWNDSLIKQFYSDILNLKKGLDGIRKTKDAKSKEVSALYSDIVEKGKNITSVQPTVNEINRSLKAYGFDNFSIQKVEDKENQYCIKRNDGSSAMGTLSEGEETFLTFLYFMQMTKGSSDPDHISDPKIIVLDDPISSLDSTILYIVGAMVKDLSKAVKNGDGNVKQLFVLTHNVFFHKEASFINGRSNECKDVNYWIVRKENGISTIESYDKKNPISTSYELLWSELRENKNSSLITIQNIMRRIIEYYFGIIGNKLDDDLVDKFDTIEEKTIARSLLYWINDGSHSIPDDLYIDSYTDAVPKYKDVFEKLFVKSGQEAHYNMMMKKDISTIDNTDS